MRAILASHHPCAGALMLGDHHFLREFRRDGFDVLWIRGMVTPCSLLRRPRRSVGDWSRALHGPVPVESPAGPVPEWVAGGLLPYREAAWHRALRGLGGALYPRARRVLAAAGFGDPDVLWLGNARLVWLADLFPRAVSVHRVGDRATGFRGAAADTARLEAAVARRVDVVIATAAAIVDDLRALGVDALRVANGVETARFEGPLPPEPPALAALPRPRAVYVGAIAEWFDWDAVRAAARGVGDGSVVLVGPARGAPPAGLPANVHHRGPCPYAEVPAVLRHCDVGLMPFVANALTEDVSPLKVFEYLAAGLPVVARDLRETRSYGLPIRLAPDAAAFEPAVRAAVAESPAPDRWRAAAAPHDWRGRYALVRARIDAARAARG